MFDIFMIIVISIIIIEIIVKILTFMITIKIVDPSWIRFVETGGNYAWSHDRNLSFIVGNQEKVMKS